MSSGLALRWLSVPSVEPDNLVDQTRMPVTLAYSDALRGRIGKREDWWMCGGKDKKAQPAYSVTWLHLWSPASSIRPIAVKRLSAPSGPSKATRTPVFSQWASQRVVGKMIWVIKTGSAAKAGGFSSAPASWRPVRDFGSGTRETGAEPQDSPFFDGLLDRATKFGRAHIFLPESTPSLQLMGRGAGAPPLLRLRTQGEGVHSSP